MQTKVRGQSVIIRKQKAKTNMSERLKVDSHVHLHLVDDLPTIFDALHWQVLRLNGQQQLIQDLKLSKFILY